MTIRTPTTAVLQNDIRTYPNSTAEILLRRVREAKAAYRQQELSNAVNVERRQVLARNYLQGGNPDVLANPVPAEDLNFAQTLTTSLQRPREPGQSLQFNPNSSIPLSGRIIENDTGDSVPLTSQAQIIFSNAWDETAGEVIANTSDTAEGILENAGDYVSKVDINPTGIIDRATGTLSLVAIAAIILGVIIIAK